MNNCMSCIAMKTSISLVVSLVTLVENQNFHILPQLIVDTIAIFTGYNQSVSLACCILTFY